MAYYFKHELCSPTGLLSFLAASTALNAQLVQAGKEPGIALVTVMPYCCSDQYDLLGCYDLIKQLQAAPTQEGQASPGIQVQVRYIGMIGYDYLILAAAVGKENVFVYPSAYLQGAPDFAYSYGKTRDVEISAMNFKDVQNRLRGIVNTYFGLTADWATDFNGYGKFLPPEQLVKFGFQTPVGLFPSIPPLEDSNAVRPAGDKTIEREHDNVEDVADNEAENSDDATSETENKEGE